MLYTMLRLNLETLITVIIFLINLLKMLSQKLKLKLKLNNNPHLPLKMINKNLKELLNLKLLLNLFLMRVLMILFLRLSHNLFRNILQWFYLWSTDLVPWFNNLFITILIHTISLSIWTIKIFRICIIILLIRLKITIFNIFRLS